MRMLTANELKHRLGVSEATIWRWARTRSDFPKRRRLGANRVAWREDEIEAFIDGLEVVGRE